MLQVRLKLQVNLFPTQVNLFQPRSIFVSTQVCLFQPRSIFVSTRVNLFQPRSVCLFWFSGKKKFHLLSLHLYSPLTPRETSTMCYVKPTQQLLIEEGAKQKNTSEHPMQESLKTSLTCLFHYVYCISKKKV